MSKPAFIKHAQRYGEIIKVFYKYGFRDIIKELRTHEDIPDHDDQHSKDEVAEMESRNHWERVRLALEELGPTFIKFGQILSNRPDLLPEELIGELVKLQDAVEPFSDEEAKELVEHELEEDVNNIFCEFNSEPFAAASMAQVHCAKLLDGRKVAVKVQRPGIRENIQTDIEIMLNIAELAEKHMPDMKVLNPVALIQQFEASIKKELNFAIEAMNIERFRMHNKNEEKLVIPGIYKEYCTERVLTMDFIDGIKISDLDALKKAGINREIVARTGTELFFKQVFEHGFFHADPHPGNMLVLRDHRICYLDFGMMGIIMRSDRDNLANLFISIEQNDVKSFVRALKAIAIQTHISKNRNLEYQVQELIDQFSLFSLEEVNMNDMVIKLKNILIENKIQVPADFYLFLRALSINEGLGRTLAPGFNIIETMQPYVQKILIKRVDPKRLSKEFYFMSYDLVKMVKSIPYEVEEIIHLIKEGHLRIEFEHKNLDHLYTTLDKVSNRLVLAVILAALIIGSSLIIVAGLPPLWNEMPVIGITGFAIAACIGLWLIINILRHNKI